jgi:U3 small nucleolar RNA-associated protein 21
MVDWFKVETVATTISFSPSGDFLASAHVDRVGLYLWANRQQYTSLSLRRIADDGEPMLLALPTSSGIYADSEMSTPAGSKDNQVDATAVALVIPEFETPEQLTDSMITLSNEPKSKWQNLLRLDTIKVGMNVHYLESWNLGLMSNALAISQLETQQAQGTSESP